MELKITTSAGRAWPPKPLRTSQNIMIMPVVGDFWKHGKGFTGKAESEGRMYLNITTTAGCRGKCVYCPQDQFQRAMGERPRYLSAAEFASLMRNVRDTHFHAFSFGGFAEPFDNPEIVELLAIAQNQENVEEVWVYTNGEGVSPEIVRRLAHLRIASFDVSCHGFDPELYRRTRPFIDSNKVRENVLFLLENRPGIGRLSLSLTGPFAAPEEIDELASLCARHGAFLERRQLHSRAGLLKIGQLKTPKRGPFRCAKFGFEKPVLLPGGDLSLCCQDFGLSWIIGNLHRQRFAEIMAASALRRHVLDVASGVQEDPDLRCYQCEFCLPVSEAQRPRSGARTNDREARR
jgi:hypothetical protein